MDTYTALAEHWLNQSFERTDPAASGECLQTAQVYATLALTDAIANGLRALAEDLTGNYRH